MIIYNNNPKQIQKIRQDQMDSIDQPNIDDIIKALPLKQKVPVVALKKLLDERETNEQQQRNKTNQIKIKYQKLIQPYLQRASEIIRGGKIQQDEVSWAQDCMKPGEKINDFLKGKVIEGYWISVFNNSALVDKINEKDQQALKYLLDIQKIQDPQDMQSIQLKFIFKSNPFFKENEIKRRLDIKNGETLCLEGDLLTWKDNECLTYIIKNVTNKKTGLKTTIKGEKIKSFFDIFLNWDQQHQRQLADAAENMLEISSLLILDSVDYFLGVIDADDQSEDIEDDQSDDNENQQ